MEQALMDRLKEGTLDDIDKDMITARVKNVDKRIETVLAQISADIRVLGGICSEYQEEVSLLGFSFVCSYDSKLQQFQRKKHGTYEENDAACVYALGSADNIKAMCKAINCICDKDERG